MVLCFIWCFEMLRPLSVRILEFIQCWIVFTFFVFCWGWKLNQKIYIEKNRKLIWFTNQQKSSDVVGRSHFCHVLFLWQLDIKGFNKENKLRHLLKREFRSPTVSFYKYRSDLTAFIIISILNQSRYKFNSHKQKAS